MKNHLHRPIKILQFLTPGRIHKYLKHNFKILYLFKKMRPTRWVAHLTRDFLTSYSCLFYSSMLKVYLASHKFTHFHSFGIYLYSYLNI